MSVNGPPNIRRRNHGRGHSYYIDDVKVDGATTILGDGYPKRLDKWAADEAAKYAVNHWDELAELEITERLERIAGARFLDRDAASRRGREVHDLAHRYMVDPSIEVPDELEGHVDAYIAFVEDWQPVELLLEASVASTQWRYCGTLDAIADLADGNRWLYDIKTSRRRIYQDTALQLAAYRYAEWVLDDAGVAVPMPAVDRCGVVWVKDDRTYDFVELEVNESTFRHFLAASLIARFTRRDDVIGAPLKPPARRETV